MAKKKKHVASPPPKQTPPDTSLPAWLDKPWRFEMALAAFLVLALAVFFREFIFNSRVMLAGTDMLTQGYQTRKLGVDAVRAGQGFPLWNLFSYCGLPYAGGLPGPLFFPTSVLYYLMPLHRALGYSFILMMFFGGMFTYFWIRELGLAKIAAGVCAVAYCFTGWVASTLQGGHDSRAFTILLMPLVFFFLERALGRRKTLYFLLMGLAVALQILSPHVQMMYFSSLAVTAYFLFRLWFIYRQERTARTVFRLGAGFTLGFVFAVALSAVQFFPTLANRGFSHRQTGTGLGYEGYLHATQYSMHPLETAGLVVPGFSGEPYYYWSASSSKGHSEYMGLVVLLFAAVALACRRNRYTWFFTGLGLCALLFNFGGFTPFFKLPYHLLPQVKAFRAPNMMFFVFAFSLVTLAGYGLDCLVDRKADQGGTGKKSAGQAVKALALGAAAVLVVFLVLGLGQKELPSILGALLPDGIGQARLPALVHYYPQIIRSAFFSALVAAAVLGFVWLWHRKILPLALLLALLAVITLGDLLRMDHYWLSTVDPAQYYRRDRMIDYLEKDQEPYRVFLYPTPGTNDYWDNSLLYFKIPTINASMPLRLSWYEELMGAFTFDNFVQYPRLWNMLNARYVYIMSRNRPLQIGSIRLKPGEFQPVFERSFPFLERLLEFDSEKEGEPDKVHTVLYSNPGAWPRFRFFSKYEVLEDDKKFIALFTDQNFEPAETLILDEKPAFDPFALAQGAPDSARVSVVRYAADLLELSVETDRPALLYLAETFHPFWRATLDGAPARIYRANLAMRAVFVEPGTHRLVMRYVSAPYLWGRRLSVLSLVLLAAALAYAAFRKDW